MDDLNCNLLQHGKLDFLLLPLLSRGTYLGKGYDSLPTSSPTICHHFRTDQRVERSLKFAWKNRDKKHHQLAACYLRRTALVVENEWSQAAKHDPEMGNYTACREAKDYRT